MNTTKTEGVFDQAKGKVEQAVGEAFNNQKLANEGAADQVKGHVKEAWGNVKDTASDVAKDDSATAQANAQDDGHDVRSSITSAAANLKDSINRGLHNVEREHANQ